MRLFNTLTKGKEEFYTIKPGVVSMYSCGPTVYDYIHIGNARPLIIFDVLRRYLGYKGFTVNFIQNFTDIDDKMIDRANREGIEVTDLAVRFIEEYFKDADALGILRATHHPRATEHINDMIEFIKRLLTEGLAYQTDDDVYFNTQAFDEYGKLSGQNLEEVNVGARIDVNENKKSPLDFVLWKGQKPGEPKWDSPWGMGRPGWHIECSVMANVYLGDTIDIHSGGQDLIFPHHDNEIAQSESLSGKPFANFWLHNGFVYIDDAKMSKSSGNYYTIREILIDYSSLAVRLFMLSAHYRKPLNFSYKLLDQSENAVKRLLNFKRSIEHFVMLNELDTEHHNEISCANYKDYINRFEKAMDDDLNTAEAIAVLFDIIRDVNSLITSGLNPDEARNAYWCFNKITSVLGLQLSSSQVITDTRIMQLIERREEARKARDWSLADSIRNELKLSGIVLEDTNQGVRWRYDK